MSSKTIHAFTPDCAGGERCTRCDGTGWLEPIGPCADGSYITSRECPNCKGHGHIGCNSRAFAEEMGYKIVENY